MTTSSQNLVYSRATDAVVPDFVDEAVGIGIVDGGTPEAPSYAVTMYSIAHPGLSWTASGIVPFRQSGDKVACADGANECIMRYYRHGSREKYVAFENELFYICTVTP